MRILHVIPAVAARYGGPSTAIVAMCRALAGEGVEPLVVTTDADGPGRLDVPVGEATSWQGVPAVFFRRQWSEAFKYSRPLARWLDRHVADFDVVHIHGVLSHAPLEAAAASRRAGVPYVVRPLGTLDPWSLGQKRVRKRVLLALAARRMLRGAAAIHCTSEEERRRIEASLQLSRGTVIPLGIDPQRLSDLGPAGQNRASDPYLLVLSRIHPKKNLERLIEAFGGLVKKGDVPGWRLVIAGDGDVLYVATLKALSEQHGLRNRILFTGWVDGEARQRLIENASLFALPSIDENFGLSLMESLAAGVPALVSEGVHLAGAVRQANAGWVTGVDVESLAAGLATALAAGPELARRGQAARTLAADFQWPAMAGQLVDLYRLVRTSHVGATVPSRPATGIS